MEILIIVILAVLGVIQAFVILLQGKQISKLSDLLDRMDIGLSKQHEVIDNQQALIDNVARQFGEIPELKAKFPRKEKEEKR